MPKQGVGRMFWLTPEKRGSILLPALLYRLATGAQGNSGTPGPVLFHRATPDNLNRGWK